MGLQLHKYAETEVEVDAFDPVDLAAGQESVDPAYQPPSEPASCPASLPVIASLLVPIISYVRYPVPEPFYSLSSRRLRSKSRFC